MMGLSYDSIERHQLLADATQTFIDIDTDHSGTLSYEEVFSALENLGKRVFGTGWATPACKPPKSIKQFKK
jgi:Ca2+-binding EF-hand superfamily protein